ASRLPEREAAIGTHRDAERNRQNEDVPPAPPFMQAPERRDAGFRTRCLSCGEEFTAAGETSVCDQCQLETEAEQEPQGRGEMKTAQQRSRQRCIIGGCVLLGLLALAYFGEFDSSKPRESEVISL